MIQSSYLYSFFIIFAVCFLLYFFLSIRPGKEEINNKLLLKNLLEGLEIELPEELKALDSSSPDNKKLS